MRPCRGSSRHKFAPGLALVTQNRARAMEYPCGRIIQLPRTLWEHLFSRRWLTLLTLAMICGGSVWWVGATPDHLGRGDLAGTHGFPIPQFDWIGSVAPAGQSRIAVYGGTEVVNVWAALVHIWPESFACLVGIPAAIMLLRSIPRRGCEEHCRACGYCLRGIGSARCPECGTYLKRSNRTRGYRRPGAIPRAAVVAGMAALVSVLCINRGPRSGWVANVFQWESRDLARFAQSNRYRSLGAMVQQRTGVVIVDPDHRRIDRFVRVRTPVCRLMSATDDGRYCIVTVPGPSRKPVFGMLDAGRAICNPPVQQVRGDGPLPVFLDSSRVVILTDDSRLVVWNLELNLVEMRVDLADKLIRMWSSEALFAAYGPDGSIQVAFSSLSWPLAAVARWAPCSAYCIVLSGSGVSSTPGLVSTELREGRPVYRPNGLFLFDTASHARHPKVTLMTDSGRECTLTSNWPVGFDGCANDGRWVFGTDDAGADNVRRSGSPSLYLWSVPAMAPPNEASMTVPENNECLDQFRPPQADDSSASERLVAGTTSDTKFMSLPTRSSDVPVGSPVPSPRRQPGSTVVPKPGNTRSPSPDDGSLPAADLLPYGP